MLRERAKRSEKPIGKERAVIPEKPIPQERAIGRDKPTKRCLESESEPRDGINTLNMSEPNQERSPIKRSEP
jgi:hypothetical protein